MATVQKEVYKRGIIGKFFKWIFILFNILMLISVIMGIVNVSEVSATTDAEKAGVAIGATMGFGVLLTIWALGDIILGLLTYFSRGTKYIITEEV